MGQKISKFEDLEVWKEGISLAGRIYRELKDCCDYSLRDQMQRAAVSIPSNIAERLESTRKEKIRFFLSLNKVIAWYCSSIRLYGRIGVY